MIVVSDTSPVTALISIGETRLLCELFGEVVIPPAVRTELLRFHASLPDFLHVRLVTNHAQVTQWQDCLDLGEAEAIVLAQEIHADYLLMDEMAGREIARKEGVRVIGLLGVLCEAKRHGMLQSVAQVMERLEAKTTFFVSADLKARVLREVGETE